MPSRTELMVLHAGVTLLAVGLVALAELRVGIARRREVRYTAYVLVFAAMASLHAVHGLAFRWLDFEKYFVAAQDVLRGSPELYRWQGEQCCGYTNIPLVALFYAPFLALPSAVAGVLFAVVSVAAAATACALLVHIGGVTGWRRAAVVSMFLLWGPLDYGIRVGNSTQLILLSLVLAMMAITGGRPRLAGLLLAVAAVHKPHLALLGVWLLIRREWNALAVFVATGLGSLALSFGLLGTEVNRAWIELMRRLSGSFLQGFNNQSLGAVLYRLQASAPDLYDWIPRPGGAGLVTVVWLLSLAIAGACLAASYRGAVAEPSRAQMELSMWVCASVLVAPVTWTTYYIYALIPVSLAIAGTIEVPESRGARLGWLAAALLMAPPVLQWPAAWIDAVAIYGRLGASHYFLGGCILVGLLAASLLSRRQAGYSPSELPDPTSAQ